MNNELGKQVYRKLIYFYENKISVHFSLISSGWKYGKIIDLNEKKLTLILEENVEGKLPFLCEEIKINSIFKFKDKKSSSGNKGVEK